MGLAGAFGVALKVQFIELLGKGIMSPKRSIGRRLV